MFFFLGRANCVSALLYRPSGAAAYAQGGHSSEAPLLSEERDGKRKSKFSPSPSPLSSSSSHARSVREKV